MSSHRSIVIFSGGTAANHLVDIFESIRKSKDCPISYIIPISDNGGSTSELIRVFGGPGIGDVRSRLVRLIPRLPSTSPGFREREAIRTIFNHRLSSTSAKEAKYQWSDIVDGTSFLWTDVSSAKKELIRSFFNLVNAEITKRSRPPSSTFDFTSASVGNLFLTGARLFSGSFESAIYLLGSICGIADEGIKVIPSINSNFSHHIAAGLEDGTVIVGQNAISHPSPDVGRSVRSLRGAVVRVVVNGGGDKQSSQASSGRQWRSDRRDCAEVRQEGEQMQNGNTEEQQDEDEYRPADRDEEEEEDEEGEEDANLPGTLPTLRTKNITFNKDAHLNEELPARISRIWYINPYGQEILPPANPRAIQAITSAQAIIYSIGSLYTSLVPSLVLRGIGEALRRNTSVGGTAVRTKILILNGCLDREVGPQPPQDGAQGSVFSAIDFVDAVVRAGEQSRGIAWEPEQSSPPNGSADGGVPIKFDTSIFPPSSTVTGTESPTPALSPRPGLLSSKSESVLRHRLKQHQNLRQYQHDSHHIFPPPLLASTANSLFPSRESSPPPAVKQEKSADPIDQTTASTIESAAAKLSRVRSRPQTGSPSHSTTSISQSKPNPIYQNYVTHLIHLPNSNSTPFVDRELLLSRCGIQCIKVYGRSAGEGQGMRYDHAALRGAIEAVLGRRAERGQTGSVDGSQKGKYDTASADGNVVVGNGIGRRNTYEG